MNHKIIHLQQSQKKRKSSSYEPTMPKSVVVWLILTFLTVVVVCSSLRSWINKEKGQERTVYKQSFVPEMMTGATQQTAAASWTTTIRRDNLADEREELLERTSPLSQPTTTNMVKNRHDENNSTACNCFQAHYQMKHHCCQRRIRRFHKMGYVLIDELFPSRSYSRIRKESIPRNYDAMADQSQPVDYRDVVITRNFYDAIISGT